MTPFVRSLRAGAGRAASRPHPSVNPLRHSSSSTSTSSTPAARDLSKSAAALRPINPRTTFNADLSKKRKEYHLQGKLAAQKQAAAEAAERKRTEERSKELNEKIRRFKRERELSFNDQSSDSATTTTSFPPSPVDAILNPKKTGAKAETAAAKGKAAKEDPVFASRERLWAQYRNARRQQRFENEVAERSAQSERRLESLLYLYHSARSFVTYDNVDEKVRALTVRNSRTSEGQGTKEFEKMRAKTLKDTLEGTLNDGRIGVQALKDWAETSQETDEQREKRERFFEARRLQLDASRAAPGKL